MPSDGDSSGPMEGPNWYLREWAKVRGKKQAGLVTELDIHKTTAHRLWTGKQPYRRDFVLKIAAWLDIEPYELLMHPNDALALRQFREAANQISRLTGANEPATYANAAEEGQPFDHERPRSPPPKRTGTRG